MTKTTLITTFCTLICLSASALANEALHKKITKIQNVAQYVGYTDGYLLIDDVLTKRNPNSPLVLKPAERLKMQKENGAQNALIKAEIAKLPQDYMCAGALADVVRDGQGSYFLFTTSSAMKSIGGSESEQKSLAAVSSLVKREQGLVEIAVSACSK